MHTDHKKRILGRMNEAVKMKSHMSDIVSGYNTHVIYDEAYIFE